MGGDGLDAGWHHEPMPVVFRPCEPAALPASDLIAQLLAE
jgi:hypothetical protein